MNPALNTPQQQADGMQKSSLGASPMANTGTGCMLMGKRLHSEHFPRLTDWFGKSKGKHKPGAQAPGNEREVTTMTRQQKYPETRSFHFHNANPKGRITTDCVIRAITTATEQPYEEIVRSLAEWQIETGYDDGDTKAYGAWLEAHGWKKQKQPRKQDGSKYTGKQFCAMLKKEGNHERIIAHIGGHHIIAIVDCKVWDIWDSTGKCIGNFWTKEE
jgi:hypothetical protein